MTAMAHMELEDWAAAGELFEELHTRYPVLAPYPAYHAARCRLRRGDNEGALAWVAEVPEGTVLEAEAALIRLDALADAEPVCRGRARGRRSSSSASPTARAGPRRCSGGPQAMEKLDRAGGRGRRAVPEDLVRGAAGGLGAPGRGAPDRRWPAGRRPRAGRGQAAAAARAGRSRPVPTAEEWLTRGMILFDRNQNESAEAAFGSALSVAATTQPGGGSPELRCQAEFHRAQSVFKQRERTRAVPLFAQAAGGLQAGGQQGPVHQVDVPGRPLHEHGAGRRTRR